MELVLIGGTLIEQIQKQAGFLLKNQYVELRIVALANSKTMLFDEDGIDLANWRNLLAESTDKSDLQGFIERMKSWNLPNSVFIDNTANKEIVQFYPEILNASISISTPNKVAVSGTYEEYTNLKRLADRK